MLLNRRGRYLIDWPVQLGLLRRVCLYAGYCLITATLLVFFWRMIMGGVARPHQHLLAALYEAAPMLLALLAILPFVAFDLLKLTNRFAGPVYRIRVALESLARGDTIPPVRFRDGDYWCELGPKINVLAARLGQLESPGQYDSQAESAADDQFQAIL